MNSIKEVLFPDFHGERIICQQDSERTLKVKATSFAYSSLMIIVSKKWTI